MSELAKKVKSLLNDVYFGKGDTVTVGGVVFNRFGFSFKGTSKTVPDYLLNVEEADGMVWIEFYGTTGTEPVVVGIPSKNISI